MDALARTLEIEGIKKLKARYFRFVDTHDWSGLDTIFTDDAILDTSAVTGTKLGSPILEGGKNIAKMISTALAEATSVHHGHMPEIEIVSETEATAIWPFEDIIVRADGSATRKLQGYGHYTERYEKVGGAWKIAKSVITRLYVETRLLDA